MVASLRSHRPRALAWPGVPRLRTPFGRVLAPPALRVSAVRKASLRALLRCLHCGSSAAIARLNSSMVVLQSSHRACASAGPVFRVCGLRFALCPRGFSRFAASDESRTPSLSGLLRPVSRTARGLRAPHWLRHLFRPHWGLRTGLRFAGPVFRGCGRPLGVSSPLHPFGASTATACFAHCARRSSVPIGLTSRCFAHSAHASCATLVLSLGVF